ncbi:TetR/AcrR family transcriptional regulator [Cohnella abietis]|uniref:HTH tetR-type domain-containing protein n=1 Tax=Cohnella abietis TaxID=2507935 RepID=A0A3T1DD89_9BACL|nr:TetR/AcrR family transcriptional regulator [Cohnella abietis]BBI35915.1 hypothetical protein KCTCHS21_53140 [Cohnella abietis]
MSPRNIKRDQLIREEKKQQILDSALNLGVRLGIGSTKISDIATESNLTQGHIYNFFESKHQLFMVLTEQLQHNYSNQLKEAANQPGTAKDKLLHLVRIFMDENNKIAEITLFLMQMQLSEMVTKDEKIDIVERSKENFNTVVSIVAEGQKTNLFRQGDTNELALEFYSMLSGFVLLRLRRTDIKVHLPEDHFVQTIVAAHLRL